MGTEKFAAYKCHAVPRQVEQELRSAAAVAGMSLKGAFAALLRPPKSDSTDQEWRDHLQGLIWDGQMKSVRTANLDGGVTVSLHIPVSYKDALKTATKELGVNVTAAGKMILIAYSEKMAETLLERCKPTTV